MKKFAVLLFALLYLVSSSGLAISTFYCCGKYKESYIFKANVLSNKCKGNKLPGCCKTKTVLVKVKDSHSPAQELKFAPNNFTLQLFAIAVVSVQSLFNSEESTTFAFIHAPPFKSKSPVYLSNNNFRI